MSEVRSFVAYDDIRVGDDFNSRKSFRTFVTKAFNTAENGKNTLKPEAELKAALTSSERGILESLQGLAASIETDGLIQPLVVREGGPSKTDGRRRYFLLAGERRFYAIAIIRESNPNKFKQVDVKLRKGNAEDNARVNLIENLQRDDLEPLEEARALRQYIDQFGLTQLQAAEQLGLKAPHISQRLALLDSAPEVVAAVEKGEITATHAREMTSLPAEHQQQVLAKVKEQKKSGKKVSVQDVKVEADKHKRELGIKQTKERKPKEGETYDTEKVKVAKEILADRDINLRPKKALFEQYGALSQRLGNPTISEETRAATKVKIAALEFVFGIRDTL